MVICYHGMDSDVFMKYIQFTGCDEAHIVTVVFNIVTIIVFIYLGQTANFDKRLADGP